ncbi:MAG: mannosyltransferase family protein [Pseudomonadota bacterium]
MTEFAPEAAATAPPPPKPAPSRYRRKIPGLCSEDWQVLLTVLILSLVTLLFGAIAYELTADRRIGPPLHWLAIWNWWDAPHYLELARRGYRNVGDDRFLIVFYPLFPWLVRLVSAAVRSALISAFIVSGLASFALGVFFRRLVALDYSRRIASDSVWFMFIFPTAYFLHIGYTEALFLALVIGAFLAARTEHWLSAGILGGLASLTRVNGILLVAALGVEALHQLWTIGRWRNRWLWLLLVPAGFLVYLWLNYHVYGNPLQFRLFENRHWGEGLYWPWRGIGETYRAVLWRQPSDAQMMGVQVLLFLAIGLAGTIASCVMLRPSYAAWNVVNLVLFASQTFDLSGPRYMLTLFPVFIVFAMVARDRKWNALITFWSLLSMGLFISRFVRGLWAF